MKCPVCDVTLVISSREGIEIDHCPQCRGVWLDRGELDKIIERAAPAVVGVAGRNPATSGIVSTIVIEGVATTTTTTTGTAAAAVASAAASSKTSSTSISGFSAWMTARSGGNPYRERIS